MPTIALTNATVFVNDTDMTAFLNKIALKSMAADLKVTTFGSSWEQRIGGLKDTSFSEEGYWSAPAPDAQRFAALGVSNLAFTISPQGTETGPAYMFLGGDFSYSAFGKIGEAVPFSVTAAGTDGVTGLIGGQLASASRTISGTGQVGSILTMTGPTATQFLYCTFHVFTAATTVTIQVQSATTLGFGAPTTRATIGPLTTTGGTFMTRVAGPITDGFWRLNCTAITGSFVVAGAIGIK